jgi:hypothetical protein
MSSKRDRLSIEKVEELGRGEEVVTWPELSEEERAELAAEYGVRRNPTEAPDMFDRHRRYTIDQIRDVLLERAYVPRMRAPAISGVGGSEGRLERAKSRNASTAANCSGNAATISGTAPAQLIARPQ